MQQVIMSLGSTDLSFEWLSSMWCKIFHSVSKFNIQVVFRAGLTAVEPASKHHLLWETTVLYWMARSLKTGSTVYMVYVLKCPEVPL